MRSTSRTKPTSSDGSDTIEGSPHASLATPAYGTAAPEGTPARLAIYVRASFKSLVTLSRLISGAPLRGTHGEFTLERGVTFDDLVWNGNSRLPIKFRLWLTEDEDDAPGY